MIGLDTDVISELLRKACDLVVPAWLNARRQDTLDTTTINLAELYAGVALLPAGKRKKELDLRLRAALLRLFQGRLLDFDLAAGKSYARIAEEAKAGGKIVPHDDGLIAAIARAHGFAVATRNVSNFASAGVALINPWEFESQ